VDFDPVSTDRALRQAGLSLWGSNRPALLGWWLSDSTEGSAAWSVMASRLPSRCAVRPSIAACLCACRWAT
jgi:hypothetical protein